MKTIDGLSLAREQRLLLKPGEKLSDWRGQHHRFPRYFYELNSWQEAKQWQLAPHFRLAELMSVDCREAAQLLRTGPHFVPCAVSVLARYLEEFRVRVEAPVYVSVNGGYRSPAHQRHGQNASIHSWATAVDIYRIGDCWLDSQKHIERFARVAQSIDPGLHVKPFGQGPAPGQTNDHLHFDLGFLTLVPHGCCES